MVERQLSLDSLWREPAIQKDRPTGMAPIKTVAYKGSKRRITDKILALAREINARWVFDGFSGTGVVSAMLRSAGLRVTANDLNPSSCVYGRVFLRGFNTAIVAGHIEKMNNLPPVEGWITEHYSGTRKRLVRDGGGEQDRPLAYTRENAMLIDAWRGYVRDADVDELTKDALLFAIIAAADRVFNNSNDQKSSLKKWSSKSARVATVAVPTRIDGPLGEQLRGDIFTVSIPPVDMVYLDPPYTSTVMYGCCYHLSDTLAMGDCPRLDDTYAIPRAQRAIFRDQPTPAFYSKRRAKEDFRRLLRRFDGVSRVVVSYSDAPRNAICIDDLLGVCAEIGRVTVRSVAHPLCPQPSDMNKVSTELTEFFIVIDQPNSKDKDNGTK